MDKKKEILKYLFWTLQPVYYACIGFFGHFFVLGVKFLEIRETDALFLRAVSLFDALETDFGRRIYVHVFNVHAE